jgi:hypothetical protein
VNEEEIKTRADTREPTHYAGATAAAFRAGYHVALNDAVEPVRKIMLVSGGVGVLAGAVLFMALHYFFPH